MTTPAGWEDILDQEETILWQGRPDPALSFGAGQIFILVFGAFFAGCAAYLMITSGALGDGFSVMVGLAFLIVGLQLIVIPTFGPVWVRRHTWYTLTNRRAFIAREVPILGRSLDSYVITADTDISFDGAEPGTLYFAKSTRTAKAGTSSTPIGFERIADAHTVHDLLRQVQRGHA